MARLGLVDFPIGKSHIGRLQDGDRPIAPPPRSGRPRKAGRTWQLLSVSLYPKGGSDIGHVMKHTHERHWEPFIAGTAIAAAVSAAIDLALGNMVQAASSGCMLIGIIAFGRSLRFQSIRWRVIAGVALVVAIALQMMRFALA